MPFIIGAATALPKLYQAYQQNAALNNLKLQDTTTPEEREMLAIARQRAAAGLPGLGMLQGRLEQNQNATIQNATLGAGSGSDLLAAVGAADSTRTTGELQLGLQGEQYNERAQAGLGQQLGLAAQHRQRDLATYNQTKASLISGEAQNLNNAVDGAAAYGAYGLNRQDAAAAAAALAAKNTAATTAVAPAAGYDTYGTGSAGYIPGMGRTGRWQNSFLGLGYPGRY